MRARIGAVRDAVAVDVEIAAEILAGVEIGGGHHLAAVVFLAVVPLERPAQPIVHADLEIEHDEHRRLQPVGEIERLGAELERLGRVLRQQQNVLGVAVRGIGAVEDVGLLRARRHAGRGAGTLHVEHHRRDFGEIGEAEELLHQRDAGAGGRGEGAGAVPGGADDDADRGEFVLALHDRDPVLLGLGIDAQPLGSTT